MAVLHQEFTNQKVNKSDISNVDLEIRRIIEQNSSENFEDYLMDEDRFEVFYHLSHLRTSLLSWYEFKQNAELLEIGGEFGALTGLFCDRCSHVTVIENNLFRAESICKRYHSRDNLEVYPGDFEEIHFNKRFDYITVIGLLETIGKGSSDKNIYAEYLKKLSKLLKPEGKLLLAVENRYGIRYFCGAKDSRSGRPFDGINHYNRGAAAYTFSRQELQDILILADLPQHKFYYPLPDYRITQLVYTDQYLPQKNLKERLIPYYQDPSTLLAYEQDIYDDLTDNHVFPFFANSFLAECTLQSDINSVIYAAISLDRGKEKAFATTIHTDKKVKKQILFPEGMKHLQKVYNNIRDLSAHGIPVVQHELEQDALIMPYVNTGSLSDYLRELVRTDKDQVLKVFDRLYEYILTSSGHASAEDNTLLSERTSKLDWGIILQKAYIELIPLNCFYYEGQYHFYDQEFVRDNYPAKYILFRAIHYFYCFAYHAHAILPMKILQERYGLTELWDVFLSEEDRFLHEVRRHNLYNQFYQWAKVDRYRMYQNSLMLSYRGESLIEFEITPRLEKIQRVQLELLDKLTELCNKNNLRFYLIYGTLLGAVRHQGFIPWDDDVDVALPRDDYDQLLQIAEKEMEAPYFLQTPENDRECFYGGYSKLRNSNTTGIELMNWGHNCNHGIWIDIFPLDTAYYDKLRNNRKIKKIRYYQRLLFAQIYSAEKSFRDMKPAQWKRYLFLSGFYRRELLYKRLNEALKDGNQKTSDKLGIFTHYSGNYEARYFNREDFASSALLYFENRKLPVPAGYDRCLSDTFGSNYMRYPAIEERKPHHNAFFAPNVPYQTYAARFFDIFKNTKGKTMVLFGAGLMFEDYMKKQGDTHRPDFLVDNDQAKWGTSKQGIMIQSPEELLKLDKDKLHLIICNIHYRKIETQLRRMGITDYYIYVQNKDWLTSDPPEQR